MNEDSISSATVLRWLELGAQAFQAHREELTALDAAIGDADHGANMARGFNAVQGKLASLKGQDIGAIFKSVAMTLISTVGGASGPLYGTFFLQAAAKSMGRASLNHAELFTAFEAGLQGLMSRGKASVGDKTMVDALVPAVAALKPGVAPNLCRALDAAVTAAREGSDSTSPLVARKGRASYLGERSAGHRDPGSASTVLIFEALQQAAHPPA